MTIHSPRLFGFSVFMIITALAEGLLANQALVTMATRDFNFALPFLMMIAAFQAVVGAVGVALSLQKPAQ